MEVQEAKMGPSVPHLQVQQEAAEQPESEKLPTSEDVDECGVIYKKLLSMLEDWKKSDIMPSRAQMNPPIVPNVIVAGDDEGSATFEKEDVEEPIKAPAKKRGSKKAAAPNIVDIPPSYVNKIHHFMHGTWQHGYGQAWIKVRKVYFPYNLQGSHWVAIGIDFVRHTMTVYDFYIAFTSTSKLVKYLQPISDTLARVLYDMPFYDTSKVEEVKQNVIKMSTFTPFIVCCIGDVPQQRDE
ncbi:hypothetical protein L3X38_006450 [Prunus dulcis]|uniref:Ubiquitin-like protease family profile domain-containing protein n=1 Tax=Prunus dulcis TaxID=3755 RepID=A0AAD4ZT08_PRUDU|nr:hypothetical protein L3X38_006450 [Prunus dulcis]